MTKLEAIKQRLAASHWLNDGRPDPRQTSICREDIELLLRVVGEIKERARAWHQGDTLSLTGLDTILDALDEEEA